MELHRLYINGIFISLYTYSFFNILAVPGCVCWRFIHGCMYIYNGCKHCGPHHLSYWSGRRLCFLTAGQLLWPVRGAVHCEVLSPRDAPSPFLHTPPPSHSAKKDVLLNTNIIYCNDFSLRKFLILWFCLFILCTAVQLKVWHFTVSM